jgi:mRNA-degrading endonuclease RelE of RelBE toxin-antitoxin system
LVPGNRWQTRGHKIRLTKNVYASTLLPIPLANPTMYTIKFVAGVVGDLAALRPYDRRRVLDRIDAELGDAPIAATRNRKLLPGLQPPWDQELPIWELRVGEYRVFYDVQEQARLVTVRAIRLKPPHKTTEEIL